MNNLIKLLVVDDMEPHRIRLERIINAAEDMILVASAKSGYEAVMFAAMHQPDIILMDVQMEDKIAGITASKAINQQFPDIKIIILTVAEDDSTIIAAFQTGIVDYLFKTASNDEIQEAIRSAHINLSPIRPIIAEKIRSEFKKVKTQEDSILFVVKIISELTSSEINVLKLLCEGKNRRQVAEIRCVELDTIKKQINSILKKFDSSTSKEVVKIVNDLKIFDLLNSIN